MRPELNKTYELNPNRISDEVVEKVAGVMTGDPSVDCDTLWKGWIHGSALQEQVNAEFQVFGLGFGGWRIVLDQETQEKFGVNLEEIDCFGPEHMMPVEGNDNYWQQMGGDWFEGINVMRMFVGSHFIEEAKARFLPPVAVNSRLIEPYPVTPVQRSIASAKKPGFYMYDRETVLANWKQKSPAFYEATQGLIDRFTPHYSGRTQTSYQNLPKGLLDHLQPEISERWHDNLTEYAVRTYACLDPKSPLLIPVPVKPSM